MSTLKALIFRLNVARLCAVLLSVEAPTNLIILQRIEREKTKLNVLISDQCLKTFYTRKLRLSIIS
jgi:hypothetical protein